MKKIFWIFLLFFILINNTNASKIENFSYFDKDFSIPKETKILNHYLEVYKKNENKNILWDKKNEIVDYLEKKIWVKKTQNLFKNNILYLADNWWKKIILSKLSENTNNENINTLSFHHRIELSNQNQEDIIFNFFPIKDYKFLDDFYFQSLIRNSYVWEKGYPQLLIFDDILLPHNIQTSFYYSNDENRTSKYIKYSEENLKIEKKYFFRKYQFWDEQFNFLIPYFEIQIPFSKSKSTSESPVKDDLYISYDVIENIYYGQYYIPIIKNWEKISSFEYEKY